MRGRSQRVTNSRSEWISPEGSIALPSTFRSMLRGAFDRFLTVVIGSDRAAQEDNPVDSAHVDEAGPARQRIADLLLDCGLQ